jgi:hypothetical protein
VAPDVARKRFGADSLILYIVNSGAARRTRHLKRNDSTSNWHFALASYSSMIFSENR